MVTENSVPSENTEVPHLHLPILDSAASSWSRSAIRFSIRAFVCADRVFGNDRSLVQELQDLFAANIGGAGMQSSAHSYDPLRPRRPTVGPKEHLEVAP